MKNTIHKILFILGFCAAAFPQTAAAQTISGCNFSQRHIELFAGNNAIDYSQIWAIEEGADGFVFAATNEGLAMFDGVRWRLYSLPGEPILRSLHYDKISGKLYSSGVNTFGYWLFDTKGDVEYTPLYKNKNARRLSEDFWRICSRDNGRVFYFQTHNSLYKYMPETSEVKRVVLPEGSVAYSFGVDNRIYIQIDDTLFLLSEDDTLSALARLPSRVVSMFSGNSGIILAVEHSGLFRLESGSLRPLDNKLNARLSAAKINCCLPYLDGFLAGTTKEGLIIIGSSYAASDNPSEYPDLLSQTILSLAVDSRANVWLGFNSGIAKIDISSNEHYIFSKQFGLVMSVLSKGGLTLVATNKGLFKVSGAADTVTQIEGTQGVAWKIVDTGKHIYVLHDQGLFEYMDGAVKLVRGGGIINLVAMQRRKGYFIACGYNKLSLYKLNGETLEFEGNVEGFNSYPNRLTADSSDYLWLVVPGEGFQRLKLSDDMLKVEQTQDFDIPFDRQSSPKALFITNINGTFVLYGSNRAWTCDGFSKELSENEGLTATFSMCGQNLLWVEQRDNKLWYISQDDMGYLELISGKALKHSGIFGQRRRGRVNAQFFSLGDYVAVGLDNCIGFVKPGGSPADAIEIGKMEAFGADRSKVYDKSDKVFRIPYSMNNIRIYPVSIPKGAMVDYRVTSVSRDWITVKINDAISISALPPGNHIVEIRPSGIADQDKYVLLRINVAPPWYISAYAIILYVVVFISILIVLRAYYRRQNKAREARLKAHQTEILERVKLQRDKQVAELQSEQIGIELREKDKRLATITMNSIKRNNILNELKGDLSQIPAAENHAAVKQQINKVIRKINTQLSNEDDWKKSERYFNAIYDGLLDQLKLRYPSLTKTDMKLCVYIKLNLSTKEMAELMNISPRSIEMAKYRLRKKLGLAPNEHIDKIFS